MSESSETAIVPYSELGALRGELAALKKEVKVRKGFQNAGRFVGSVAGMPEVGSRVGGAVASLLGHGDYELRVNSLMGKMLPELAGTTVPYFSRQGRRGVRVTDREYIGDVSAAAAGVFSNNSYPINPGMSATFPWLSTIANSFEEYEFLGLVFDFVSTSAAYGGGSSQALGAVALAVDYDPIDPPYSTMVQLQNAEGACSTRTSYDLEMGVECDRAERGPRVLYNRFTSVPVGATLMDYDWGNFQVATAGSPAAGATVVGQLWASYDVVLYKKDLTSGVGGSVLDTAITKGTGTVAAATLFGTLGTIPQSGTMPVAVSTVAGATVLTFPSTLRSGTFEVACYWQGSATTITQPTLTYSNCAVPTLGPRNFAGAVVAPGSGTTSAVVMMNTTMVTISGPSATITFTGAVVPSSASVAQCLITQILDCTGQWAVEPLT